MTNLRLSNADRRQCLFEFTNTAPELIGGKDKREVDLLSDISFEEFCGYLRFTPTYAQKALVHYTFSQRITNAPAAHGVGKSMISSVLVLYATICKKALVISTAPTRRQVESIIWRNVNEFFNILKRNRDFQRKYGIDLRRDYAIGQTFLRQVDVEKITSSRRRFWFEELVFEMIEDTIAESRTEDDVAALGYAFGFTSKKDTSSFQGLHAPKLLMILDEATGVEDVIHEAALACVTGTGNHMLKIGNPTDRFGAFYRSCVSDGCYLITAFDHPNVAPFYKFNEATGRYDLIDKSCLDPEYQDPIPGAVSPKWIEESIMKYGINSLFVRTRIYARFPMLGQGTTNIISPALVAKSQELFEYTDFHLQQLQSSPLFVGLDVGETGDSSVLVLGQWIRDYNMRNPTYGWFCVRAVYEREPSGLADGIEQQRIFEWSREIIEGFRSSTFLGANSVYIQIDSTGLGSGIAKDYLVDTKYTTTPIHFASAANDNKSYINVRAEMYFDLARLYEKAIIRYFQSVSPSDIEEIHYQLSGTSYEIDLKNERMKIIPKELIIQILGRSPDHADALCLAARGLKIAEIFN